MGTVAEDYAERLAEWSDIQGHMPVLHEEAASRPGAVVIELGVRRGFSTSALLAGVARSGGHLWSVDRAPADQVPAHWHELDCWHFLQSDSVSQEARDWLPAACDVLFDDSAHEYEKTLAELRAYVPRVRPGGVVLAHDPDYEGWHDEMTQPQPDFPVAAALDAYCAETGLTWERWAGERWEGSFGMGIIRP